MKDGIKNIGKDSAWYFGTNVIHVVLGFLAVPILTRMLSEKEYGIYSLAVVTVGFASILLSWLAAGTVRYYAEHEKSDRVDVFYSTVLHFIPHFTLITLVLGVPLALLLLPPGQYRTMGTLCVFIYVLTSVLYVELSILRAKRKVVIYSIGFLADPLGRFALGLVLLSALGMGLVGIFWGWLIALAIAVPLGFAALNIREHYRGSDYSSELLKELLRFGLPISASYIMFWTLNLSDRYLVGIFKGVAELGLYSVIYTLTMSVFSVLFTAIILGGEPVIIQTYEKEGEEQTRSLITVLTRYFLVLMVPMAIGFIILQVRVMQVLVGAQFFSAHKATVPLVLGFCAEKLSWFAVLGFILKKDTRRLLLYVSISAGANIVLNLVFIPVFGYMAAAFSTMVSYFLYLALTVIFSRRLLAWNFPWKSLMRILVACAGMGGVLILLDYTIFSGLWGLLIIIAAGTVTYFLGLLLVRELSWSEVQTVLWYIRKKLADFIPWVEVG